MHAAVAAAGAIAVLLAFGLGWLARARSRPAGVAVPIGKAVRSDPLEGKLTATWRLAELGKPLVLARDLEAEVPAGARVVAAGQVTAQALAAGQVRQAGDVPAEVAVSDDGRRALLFLGGVRPGALAWLTADPAVVARLLGEATRLWERAEPYREALPLQAAAGRIGIDVQTQGLVDDVLPHQGSFLMRLADGDARLAVRLPRDAGELRGQRVLVRGRMRRDPAGYPELLADDVRPLQ